MTDPLAEIREKLKGGKTQPRTGKFDAQRDVKKYPSETPADITDEELQSHYARGSASGTNSHLNGLRTLWNVATGKNR